MIPANIAGCKGINQYVDQKLRRFDSAEKSFSVLFELMFSESDNVLFEQSIGFRIQKTTYGECRDTILLRAATLKQMLGDAAHGSVVGLYMDNSRSWIEMFWAILLCGCRPLLMNLRMSDELLSSVLDEAKAVAVISDGKTFPLRTLIESEITPAQAELSTDNMGSEILLTSSGTSLHVKLCAYGAEEFARQISDSGTLIRHCAQVKKHYNGELKLLTFLPFYHIFGLTAMYIWFAFFSRTFVLLNDLSAQTLLNTIRRHKVTHIFAVPLLWEKVYEEAMRTIEKRAQKTLAKFEKGLKLSDLFGRVPCFGASINKRLFKEIRENLFGDSVLFTITGGSFVRAEVLRFFNAIGYYLCNGYGMTEIGITSVELDRRAAVRNSGSIGDPFSSVEYRISADGILEVRGLSTARSITVDGIRHERGDEWFSTGDMAEYRNGHYYLKGRSDDMVLGLTGENLNPQLIERELTVDGCEGICLIGGRDTEPTLLLQISPYSYADCAEQIKKKVATRLNELRLSPQIRSLILTTDRLMEENDFKISRAAVRARFSEGKIRPYKAVPADQNALSDEIESKIQEMMAFSLRRPAASIHRTDDFFTDLGGSSLDHYALTTALEESFGVAFPQNGSASLTSIQAIAEYIKKELRNVHQSV